MTSESTYQPNFVLTEDDAPSSEKKIKKDTVNASIDVEKTIEQVSSPLIEREIAYIERQRCKLRLIDPKGVYFYRHASISYFQASMHVFSLFISCYLIYLLLVEASLSSKGYVDRVGWVSDTTLIDSLTNLICIAIVFTQLIGLFKLQKLAGGNRYKLAMMANAINRVVVNHLKLFIFTIIAVNLYSANVSGALSVDQIFKILSNSVLSDLTEALFSVISITIFVRAFRFCKKELTE